MRSHVRAAISAVSATVAVAVTLSGCGRAPGTEEGAPPAFLAPFIESARKSLVTHEDALVRSTLAFREARCRADGGVLIVFSQHRFGLASGAAYAMGGSDKIAGSWAGGHEVSDIVSDPEMAHFFAESPEVACTEALLDRVEP